MNPRRIVRQIFILLLLSVSDLIYANNPLLIYRNDGAFNAIDYNEIDSISFSNYDIDSIQHPSVVVQDIWTTNGVIRIPLSCIERVSNVPPVTKMKQDALELKNELLEQLIYVENDTILHFNPEILENKALKTGVKLASLKTSEKLPVGFCGEINTINRQTDEVIITCTSAKLSDVYDSLFLYSDIKLTNNGYLDFAEESSATTRSSVAANTSRIIADIDKSLNLPTLRRSIALGNSWELTDLLNIGTSGEMALEVAPKLRVKSCIVLENGRLDTSTSIIADLYLSEDFSLSYKGNIEKEFSLHTMQLPMAVAPMFKLFVKGGIRASLDGALGLNVGFKQHYRLSAATSYSSASSSESLNSEINYALIEKSSNREDSYGESSFKIGPFLQLGIAAITPDLVNINVEVESGVQFDAHANIDYESLRNASRSTDLYENLSKPDAIKVGEYRTASLNAEILKGLCKKSLAIGKKLKPWWSSSVFPIISDIEADRNNQEITQIDVKGNLSPGLVSRDRVSFCIKEDTDEENNGFLDIIPDITYTQNSDGYILSTEFCDLDIDKAYIIHPNITLGNYMILAKPKVSIGKDECTIDNVHQTGYEYISDKNALIFIDIDTRCDSDHWTIGVREHGSQKEVSELMNVEKGQETIKLSLPVITDNIEFENKWPYSYSNEYEIVPYISEGKPYDKNTYLTTLSLEYIPDTYYLVGNFQGWELEKNVLEFKSLGNNRYQVDVQAEVNYNGEYEPVFCKIIPDVKGRTWVYQIGGADGSLNNGETNIELYGKDSYTITIDMNSFTYNVN